MENKKLGISKVATSILTDLDKDKILEDLKKRVEEQEKVVVLVDSVNMKINGLVNALLKVVYGIIGYKKDGNKKEIDLDLDKLVVQSLILQRVDENNIVEGVRVLKDEEELKDLDITKEDIAKALAKMYNTTEDKVEFDW